MVAKTQFDPQNPDALFSPDQWLNQFSNFNNAALPWPSSYVGMPTDAMGQPIQPPPGMTLNSSPAPAAPAAAAAAPAAPQASTPVHGVGGLQPGQWDGANGLPMGNPGGPIRMATGSDGMPYGQTSLGRGVTGSSWQPSPLQPQQATPAAPAAQSAASGPTYPQILSMLANPGKVTTPGATVPQTASVQPGSANLQSFLKNWQPAQSGPGSGFQQNFATALKGHGIRMMPWTFSTCFRG